CALSMNLNILEDGDDMRLVPSIGVSLSGGRKARVASARAVYIRTQYVLLNDPLSPVVRHRYSE
ncbi:hypothetical protein BKA70DRAFT_1081493, partial [Coprinopsis sp. MPI-PUGE-AT-0042]